MALKPLYNLNGQTTDKNGKSYILFYRSGSVNSECAYDSLKRLKGIDIYVVDVNKTRDLHQGFGINSVPSLVITKDNKVQNVIKGCQTDNYYEQIIKEEGTGIKDLNGQTQKRVVVYSTPTCQFCNKLKQYFNKHGVKYTDINVAVNQNAAMEMFRKSGQRGVPQTEIGGQMIIGFDTQKLSKLLNIPTE